MFVDVRISLVPCHGSKVAAVPGHRDEALGRRPGAMGPGQGSPTWGPPTPALAPTTPCQWHGTGASFLLVKSQDYISQESWH